MELLPRIAWSLRNKRIWIWLISTLGLACGVWGQLAPLRGEVPAIGPMYLGFLVAAIGGALHSIAFWFSPGKDGVRSRFDRLAWFVRPYPFLEVSLSLMWLTALAVNGLRLLAVGSEEPAAAASASSSLRGTGEAGRSGVSIQRARTPKP